MDRPWDYHTKSKTLAEKAMATHSSTLAWIPWAEEPGGLQSMGSLRVGHDWVTSLSLFTFMHWRRKWQPTPVFLPGESQWWGSLVGCRLWGRTRVRHDWSDLAAAAAAKLERDRQMQQNITLTCTLESKIWCKWTCLWKRNRLIENRFLIAKEEVCQGRMESLGLADGNYYI